MNPDTAVKWIIVVCGVAFAGLVIGCASAGRDQTGVKAEIKGLEARVSTKFDNTRKIHARDIKQVNDAITMRILAIGGTLMGLSYPVGKLIWLFFGQCKHAVKRKRVTISED